MAGPFGPPPGLDLNESKQTVLWIALLLPYGFAFVTSTLRLLSRRLYGSTWWFDDWLIAGAMAIATGIVAGTIVSIREGLGNHIWLIPESDIGQHSQDVLLGLFELDVMYYVCYGAVKLAVLSFFWKVFKHSIIRRLIFLMNMAVVLWAGVAITMTILECNPVSDFWIDPLEANCPIARIPLHVGLSIVSTATNFVILLLPIPYFIVPHHSRRKNLVLAAIFVMGLGLCAVSVVRTLAVSNTDITDVDLLFNLTNAWAWTAAEVQLSIVVVNLPTLGRPLAKIMPGINEDFLVSPSGSSESLTVRRRPGMKQLRRPSSRSGIDSSLNEPAPVQDVRSSVDLGYYEADEKYRSTHFSARPWYEGLERTQRIRSLEDAIMEWERGEVPAAPSRDATMHPVIFEKVSPPIEPPPRPPPPKSAARRHAKSVDEGRSRFVRPADAAATDGTETPPHVAWLRAYEAASNDLVASMNLAIATAGEAAPLQHDTPTPPPAAAKPRRPRTRPQSPTPESPANQQRRTRSLGHTSDYLRGSVPSPDVATATEMTVTKVRMPSSRPPTRPPTRPSTRPSSPLPTEQQRADGIHVRTDVEIGFERWSQIQH